MSALRRAVPTAAALVLLAAGVRAAEPVAKDASARVLAELTLPDLKATLTHVEDVAASFAPSGTLLPGTLTALAGEKLKDPGLHGLAAGPIVVMVMAPDSAAATPGVVVFIPVKDGKAYQDATAGMGFASSSSRGLVIAASDARTLAAGRGLESRYRKAASLPARVARDFRLSLNAPRLMQLYGPLLQLGAAAAAEKLKEVPPSAKPGGTPPPEALAAIMRLEMAGAISLLEQLDELRVDLSLTPEALDSETVMVARPGTALAEVAQAPPAGPNRAAAILSGAGTMSASYRFDPARVSAFIVGLATAMSSDPALAGFLTPQVLDLIRESGAVYTGEAAMRMDMRPGRMPPFAMEGVVGVTDEARALALADAGVALAVGWLDSLSHGSEPFPVQIKLERDVRRVGGVAVHRVRFSERPAPAKAPEKKTGGKKAAEKKAADKKAADRKPADLKAADLFKIESFNTEFAFAHGYYLTAQDPADLDRLIGRAGQPGTASTLQAEKAFGPGKQAYVDYDFLGLLKAMPAFEPGKPDPFAALRGVTTEPMLYAVSLERGTIRFETRMPLSAFKALAAAAEKDKAAVVKETKD